MSMKYGTLNTCIDVTLSGLPPCRNSIPFRMELMVGLNRCQNVPPSKSNKKIVPSRGPCLNVMASVGVKLVLVEIKNLFQLQTYRQS